eukprot:ANDGO_04313.mRNA.1 hypothetical protein
MATPSSHEFGFSAIELPCIRPLSTNTWSRSGEFESKKDMETASESEVSASSIDHVHDDAAATSSSVGFFGQMEFSPKGCVLKGVPLASRASSNNKECDHLTVKVLQQYIAVKPPPLVQTAHEMAIGIQDGKRDIAKWVQEQQVFSAIQACAPSSTRSQAVSKGRRRVLLSLEVGNAGFEVEESSHPAPIPAGAFLPVKPSASPRGAPLSDPIESQYTPAFQRPLTRKKSAGTPHGKLDDSRASRASRYVQGNVTSRAHADAMLVHDGGLLSDAAVPLLKPINITKSNNTHTHTHRNETSSLFPPSHTGSRDFPAIHISRSLDDHKFPASHISGSASSRGTPSMFPSLANSHSASCTPINSRSGGRGPSSGSNDPKPPLLPALNNGSRFRTNAQYHTLIHSPS